MPYISFRRRIITYLGLGLVLLTTSIVSVIAQANDSYAEGPCYKLSNSTTIQYISPNCDKSAVTTTYTSIDGGFTFNGPKLTQGSGRTAATACDPGTNQITLSNGIAKLTQQKKESSGTGGTKCVDGTTSSTITVNGWDGATVADDAEKDSIYSSFNGSLDPVKNAYYQALGSKAPCSSQGCSDGAFKDIVYKCYQQRWNGVGQGINNASDAVKEDAAKSGFATCLSNTMKTNAGKDVGTSGEIKKVLTDKGISINGMQAAADKAAADAEANAKSAAAAANKCSDGSDPDASGNCPEAASSCGIEGMGWIICPAMTFIGSVSDGAFDFLSTTFLETKSSVLADSSVQAAWSAMRNLANVLFVIAFMVIIYSQLTSSGITNYGVKKMLPRLIIAAILVNMSFIICQLAVDLSNLLGYSLKRLFTDGIAPNIMGTTPAGQLNASGAGNGLGWAAVITGLIAGGVTIALAASTPVLLAGLLAILLIVLILVARTALIVMLTVVAPLAFVAYLLPNTEQWFKKWYKMFFGLLMVFPIIAIVFGAGNLAGGVIFRAANGDILMQIVALGAASIPLFLVPSLLKKSLDATGALGGKLAGWSSKANGRVGARVKDSSQLGRRMQEFKSGRERSRAEKAIRSRNGRFGRGVDAMIGKVPGAGRLLGTERGKVLAAKAEDDLFDEEVGLQKTLLKNEGGAKDWLSVMNDKSQSAEKRAAAAALVAAHGGRKDQLAAIHMASKVAASGDAAGAAMQKQMLANFGSRTPFALGDSERAAMMEGKYEGNIYQRLAERAQSNLTPEQLAHMDIDELNELANISSGEDSPATQAIKESVTDPAEQAKLRNAVTASMSAKISAVEGDDILKNSVADRDRVQYDRIRGSSTSPASSAGGEFEVPHTAPAGPPPSGPGPSAPRSAGPTAEERAYYGGDDRRD